MKASELIVKCLENEGVEYIFGVPGEENMDLLDALLGSSIRFVMTRHEQGAAFMADVYGRLTGKAGVCLSTLGPGATNLITGVADANMDRAPLVALTAQTDRARFHKESHQHLDILALFRPVTKWSTSLGIPEIIPEAFRKAFKLAQSEKPGATHIEIPEDVARMETDGVPLLVQRLHSGGAAPEQIEKAAHIISEAARPVVLAGNGVIRGQASEALVRFAEKLNIPVATTFMAKGVIPDTYPLSLGAIGLQTPDYVNHAFAEADVVITVGYDVVEYGPKSWNPKRDKKIMHVDMSPAEVDAAYIVNVGVVGDITSSLYALAQSATPRSAAHGLQFRQMLHDELEQGRHNNSFPLKPQRILADLRVALADDDIVISDVGAHKLWLARLFPCLQPNTYIISNGFAAIGMAMPGAVAAKLVHPNRHVVAITGDGGFLMNSQELETAVRLETPFVVLVFNDRSYGLIRWKQMQQFGRPAFVDFNNPDLVKYAESFGAVGCRIESADELAPALRAALNSNKLTIIDCPVDASENLRLTQRLSKFAARDWYSAMKIQSNILAGRTNAIRRTFQRSRLPHLFSFNARFISALGFSLLILLATSCKKKPAPPAPPEVQVITLAPTNVPIFEEWIGTLDGFVNAQIRAQVSGYLLTQNYAEGSAVKKGDLLFQIDPRPLQAALDQANAKLAQDQAQAGKTALDVKRYTPLAKEQAISEEELDNAVQANLAANAQVKADEAAVENAQLNLGFTKIMSPIDGLAGIALAQIGDLLSPSSGLLTTVSTLNPIKVNFQISEQSHLNFWRHHAAGSGAETNLELQLIFSDGSVYEQNGNFLFADRQINPNTGTLQIVGLFSNANLILRPGQYGRVRAQTHTLTNALLVPQRAVTELQGTYQVAVVGVTNNAHLQSVKVGEQVGADWVIESGLKSGDRVVVEGTQKVKEGAVVIPKPFATETNQPSQTATNSGTTSETK